MASLPSRLSYIDYTRAFAILLVVAGHWNPAPRPEWWIICFNIIYSFHMPLFLAISGYLYMHTRKQASYSRFLINKFNRLLIPYFFTSILIISIKLISQKGMYVENGVTLYSYIECLYSPVAGYFLWFMWALWWMFVIIPWFKTKSSRLFLFTIGLILNFMPWIGTEILCISQTLNMMVFFVAGTVLYDYNQILIPIDNKRGLFYLSILFASFEVAYILGVTQFKPIIAYTSIVLFPLLFKSIETKTTKTLHHILMTISAASFIIYLFHTTILGFFKSIFIDTLQNANSFIYGIIAITAICTTVMVCTILFKYILSTNRITRWMFAIPKQTTKVSKR